MKEKKFKKLVEKTLHVLEGCEVDKNGNKKMHIVGVEKLYKKLNIPDATCSADEAIALLKYYQEKSGTKVNGKLVFARDEHLQKYKTYKTWLDNKELHYR